MFKAKSQQSFKVCGKIKKNAIKKEDRTVGKYFIDKYGVDLPVINGDKMFLHHSKSASQKHYIKTQKFRRKNFGGNIFGRFLQISAENFSGRFYNVGKNFGLKKCDRFGKRAVFKGQFIEILNQMTQNCQRLDTETKMIHLCMQ